MLIVAYLHDKAAARVKAVDFLLLNLIIAVFPFATLVKICRDAFSPSLKVIYDIPKPRIEEKPHHLLLVTYCTGEAPAGGKAVTLTVSKVYNCGFPVGRYPETL